MECLCCIVIYFGLLNTFIVTEAGNITDTPWTGCEIQGLTLTCDYIPESLPQGTQYVYLVNLKILGRYANRTLKNGIFSSSSWGHVRQLTISITSDDYSYTHYFEPFCFSGLKSLEELHIHMRNILSIEPESLSGLNHLKVIDFSRCQRFPLEELTAALDYLESLKIDKLNLSSFFTRRSGINLTKDFFGVVYKRFIKVLDLSYSTFVDADMGAMSNYCDYVEFINITGCTISDWHFENVVYKTCGNLKHVDASFLIIPSRGIRGRGPDDLVYKDLVLPLDLLYNFILKPYLHLEYVDLSNFIPKSTSLTLDNVSLYFTMAGKFALKTFILSGNNIRRLNAKFFFPNITLENLDLSDCSMGFIHPDVISSCHSLKHLDLSNNNFNAMIHENTSLFLSLFKNLTKLECLSLAYNGLKYIPKTVFVYNMYLSSIDVSNNRLEYVNFIADDLLSLKYLNLRGNVIKTVDDNTLSKLNILFQQHLNVSTYFTIDLRDNPIMCSNCVSFSFVSWILQHNTIITHPSDVTCTDEEENVKTIDEHIVDEVRKKCDKPTVVLAATLSVGAAIICSIVLTFLVRHWYRARKYELIMQDRINLIQEGAADREFVVFLSYSSEDDEFVRDKVCGPLSEKLEEIIGAERDLVCEGDVNFRPGQYITNEMSTLLRRSAVVLVILTDSYLNSQYCRTEFNQALTREKPIVLMIKDHVNIDDMIPAMKDIYETRARILWRYENGDYVLRTTWENVCTSILELTDVVPINN